jgi:hypothetical protein
MDPIELRCDCGAVRGEADFTHASRVRVICHCGDCQRWVRHLGRDDANEVVQTAPSFVRITSGVEHLRAAKLRPRSGLRRWYTECCKTPLANTSGRAGVPFVGLMCAMLAKKDGAIIGRAHHVNGGKRTPLGVMLRAAWFLVASLFRGRARPSPFFDARGAIVKEPIAISDGAS